MSFSPKLGAAEVIPINKGAKSIYFSYTCPSTSTSSHPASSTDCDSESGSDSGSFPEVWTNLSGHQWEALPFVPLSTSPSSSSGSSSSLSTSLEQVRIARFDLTDHHFEKGGKFEFTYRMNTNGVFEWLGAENSNGTIEVVIVSKDLAADDSRSASDDVAGSKIEVELKKFGLNKGKSNDVESFDLGIEAKEWDEGVVWERSERIWFLTRQLVHSNPIPSISSTFESQLLLLRSKPTPTSPISKLLVLFPFSTEEVMSTIRGGDDRVWLRCLRDSKEDGIEGNLVVAKGFQGDLEEMIRRSVEIAKKELGGDRVVEEKEAMDEQEQQGVRVCTWNALGMNYYKLSDVLTWLDSLLDPSSSSSLFSEALDTVLLDDGWQDTLDSHDGQGGKLRRTLRSFGVREEWYDVETSRNGINEPLVNGSSNTAASSSANRVGVVDQIPSSSISNRANQKLADAVHRIKSKGIKKVGVWMTIAGYWDGLDPTGPMKKYDLQKCTLHSDVFEEALTTWYLPSIDQLDEYYRDYFDELKAAGVDFVKIDDQAHQNYIVTAEKADVGELKHAMLRTMRRTSDLVFGAGTTVHCMAGDPRIWGGELGLRRFNGVKNLLRNSDDYFPDQDDSHRWHIYINGMNTILSRALELVPDFDMGEELHPFGRDYHVPFRSFSPAPTYSTDVMSRPLDPEKGWSAALARRKDGSVKLIKTTNKVGAALEGRLNDDVMSEGLGSAFIVGLAFEEAKGAHLGLWNTRNKLAESMTTIDSRDVFEAFENRRPSSPVAIHVQGDDWASWIEPHQLAHLPTSRMIATPLRSISVEPKRSRIVTLVEAHSLGQVEIACFGLLDKTTGLAAINSVSVIDAKSVMSAAVSTASPSTLSTTLNTQHSPSMSTFPRPSNQSRLASILTYFTSTNTGCSSSPSIAPRDQLVAFGRDLMRRPISTLWTELQVWFSFSFAVLMWTLSARRIVTSRVSGSSHTTQRERDSRIEASESGNVTPEDSKQSITFTDEKRNKLRICLGFAGSRLGLLARQRSLANKIVLKYSLDGQAFDEKWIRKGTLTEAGQMIEIDLEGYWKANGKNLKGEQWVLDIETST